jgi:redox-sensitive bicupin YhaK (pirin superfamily)
MLTVRRAEDRGHVRMGWLDTWHTFSFGNYYDPAHMGSSALRVINDDRVAPHTGFGMHGHRNMEILTVMLEGSLTHRDSMNNEAQLTAGEYQLMSAGRGVMHSEVNQGDEPVHLLQIWIEPNVLGTEPGYQQQRLPEQPGLTLIASAEGNDGSFVIRQDARVWRGKLATGATEQVTLHPGRTAWLQVIRGAVHVKNSSATHDKHVEQGDGLEITDQELINIEAISDTDFLLFDLP